MSLRGIIELAVHLSSFRNIDLPQQGFYQIRVSLYHKSEDGAKLFYGLPYSHPTVSLNKKNQKKIAVFHDLYPGYVDDPSNSFCSKTFAIRYSNEEVELHDICQFRTEIDCSHNYLSLPYFLELELYFVDMTFINGIEHLGDPDINYSLAASLMKSVAKETIRLSYPQKGLCSMFPVSFDDSHYSVLHLGVHSILAGYTYRGMALADAEEDDFVKIVKIKEDEKKPKIGKYAKIARDIKEYLGLMFQPHSIDSNLNFLDMEIIQRLKTMHERLGALFSSWKGKGLEGGEELEKLSALNLEAVQKSPKEEKKIPPETTSTTESSIDADYLRSTTLPSSEEEKSTATNPKEKPILGEAKKEVSPEKGLEEEKKTTVAPSTEKIPKTTTILPIADTTVPKRGLPSYVACLPEKNATTAAIAFIAEMTNISSQLVQSWHKYIQLLAIIPKLVSNSLFEQHKLEINQFYGCLITKDQKSDKTYLAVNDESLGVSHKKWIKILQGGSHLRRIEPLQVMDTKTWDNLMNLPLILEEVIVRDPSTGKEIPGRSLLPAEPVEMPSIPYSMPRKKKLPHLIIFVHGYQGSSYDMRNIKNAICFRYPNNEYLCSADNEGFTEGSINDMGDKLAKEVKNFIRDFCDEGVSRISFVGHSLGGIIIRRALPLLEDFKDKMHTFFTISSPHLGCMFQGSKLVNVGMWFMKKWNKSISLGQLAMTDEKDYAKTFMYALSSAPGIEWFKNIALVSSYQDYYSPYESSRIEITKAIQGDSARGPIYIRMAENILSRIKPNQIHRVDVSFTIKKGINSFIGREAHIQFLDCDILMKILAYRYEKFFGEEE